MKITFNNKGNFSKLDRYFKRVKDAAKIDVLSEYGSKGVQALASATPVKTGLAAGSWYYEIEQGSGYSKITFCNSDIENGFPVAIMLQYGHGTGTGGWVEGRDYINPAIQPVFDDLAESAWREVTKI